MERTVICDIETDDLDAKVIHCICCLDINTKEEFVFTQDNDPGFLNFTGFSKGVKKWIGHNFLSFDAPVINRLTPAKIPVSRIEDTLILSRLISPILAGGHSLDAWGKRLGEHKLVFNDFSKLTPEMVTYCLQDLKTCNALRQHLLPQLRNYSKYCIELEHKAQHILNKQKQTGFFLDVVKAREIYSECEARAADIEKRLQTLFPPIDVVDTPSYTPKYTKDNKLTVASERKINKASKVEQNPDGTLKLYTKQEFNLGSSAQVVSRLDGIWKPTEFTPGGQPKVCEENLETVPDTAKEAKELGTYLMLKSRMKVISNWFDYYNPVTRRVHGDTISLGASTHRMAHRNPQMGNIPAVRHDTQGNLIANYGADMRSCWSVEDPEKWCMVGTDIAGIQLCLLAHLMNDKAYIDAITSGDKKKGTDIHSVNMNILREVFPTCTRDNAKTFIYALLFGAGGKRLGQIFGADAKKGQLAKDTLFNRIPGFKRVEDMCRQAERRGYITAIDGRRISTPTSHFALPALLQGNEAIVMKQVLITTKEDAKHLTWNQLAVVHDEIQAEVLREQAKELGEITVNAIRKAGEFFKLNCPLDGESKIGNNWMETH